MMSTASSATASPSTDDGEDVVRALRAQLDAVKARMEDHRAVMEAAGLAATSRAEQGDRPKS